MCLMSYGQIIFSIRVNSLWYWWYDYVRSKNKCLILPIKEGREQTLFIYITKHRYKVRCTSTLEKRIYI